MKIKSVHRIQLNTPKLVCDLTVPVTNNFKLADGPYVHNSKDISDSLAGVVYGLTMRREIWASYGIPITRVPSYVLEGNDNLTKEAIPVVEEDTEEEMGDMDRIRKRAAGDRVFYS